MSATSKAGSQEPGARIQEGKTADKPLLAPRLRRQHEARIMREEAVPRGLVFSFLDKEKLFIVMVPKREGDWSHGYVSVVIPPHEAVRLELYIEEKTATIIAALQKTATKGGAS